jgi:polyhydroxyalkanoate synthase
LWQANPLHEVIPIDWPRVVQALQAIWLDAMADPARALRAATDLFQRMSQATLEVWSDAVARWWGVPTGEQEAIRRPGKGDRRFTAPEWEANPFYQTLLQAYLLASDWLVEQAAQGDRREPDEQRVIDFQIRQFVEAMSPTNFLLTNPAALRRISETGGPASPTAPATCWRTCATAG